MKLRRTRITSGIVALALVVSVPLATAALAEGNVAATITGDPVPPGEEITLTFTIAPEDAEVTLASFSSQSTREAGNSSAMGIRPPLVRLTTRSTATRSWARA